MPSAGSVRQILACKWGCWHQNSLQKALLVLRNVTELSGKAAAELVMANQSKTGIHVVILISPHPIDPFHYCLIPCSTFLLLMAFPQADDFEHDSIINTMQKIIGIIIPPPNWFEKE